MSILDIKNRFGYNPREWEKFSLCNRLQMHKDGYKFFHSGNDGTWMCASVPPKYFKRTIIVQIGKGE